MPEREFDGQAGMDYGVGYDAVAGTVRGDCVIRSNPEAPSGASGQEIVFSLRQVENTQEFLEVLQVSASGSMRAALGRGSFKAKFASEQRINAYSIYLLVAVRVTNPARRMRDIHLTENARSLLATQGPEAFRNRCGDE